MAIQYAIITLALPLILNLWITFIVLLCSKSNLFSERNMKTFVFESLDSAIIDSGTISIECGIVWMNCYMNTLSELEREELKITQSNVLFKFGPDKVFCSIVTQACHSRLYWHKCFIH